MFSEYALIPFTMDTIAVQSKSGKKVISDYEELKERWDSRQNLQLGSIYRNYLPLSLLLLLSFCSPFIAVIYIITAILRNYLTFGGESL